MEAAAASSEVNMSDPISGDAIRQVSNVSGQIQQPQDQLQQAGDPSKFDAMLEQQGADDQQVKKILEPQSRDEVLKIPRTDEMRIQREIETRVMKMDRTDQTEYFASPLQETEKSLAHLQEKAPELPESDWRNKLMDTIDHLKAEGDKTKQFLADFQAGKEFTPQELLAIQMRSHRNGQMTKILTKSVEMSVSGMKTIFQTNV